MEETMPASPEWLDYYYQQSPVQPEIVTTAIPTTVDHHMITVPKNSTSVSPPGSMGKSIRRRSRASRKTPTTHLNASTSNFRALVQQFTGYHSSLSSFGSRRGPVNLNFELGGQREEPRPQMPRDEPSLFSLISGNTADAVYTTPSDMLNGFNDFVMGSNIPIPGEASGGSSSNESTKNDGNNYFLRGY